MILALLLSLQVAPDTQAPPDATMMVEPVAMMIAGYDANGDGLVTRAEMIAGVQHGFEAIDTDHKGSIGYIQFADWAERWLGDRNALPSPFEVDADHDDRITLAELEAAIGSTFTRLDRNGDGTLTRAELLTIRAGVDDGSRRRRH